MWLSVAQLSETGVAFARSYVRGVETAIAFAGEKWAFCCVFRVQWCHRFQRLLFMGEQWCWWFQSRHVAAPCARKSSPCAA